ncbi:glycine--tRNA ligase subunit beta [Anaerosalibacter bizertensis]|uniref:Glycine--tRNA ligase beta subunit n=2 Tax=Bacillota TaxID=1239 RepID=A0A9Q4FLT9_9FIRM|nr:glycine--tRNA ligase subunit beta [Anaerosalibacter bizertensis]MBV1817850.1 glycine--tRNA ligase subunit beta [Bacteroidales bacterium MSK.15.36]MBU5293996.1 glycine--tRNA ligase subunit beta [Anaerosalibacter bizertensis]MCB5559271.1 glycine--tRNA ligase subunit beta [Anaerosalibacter bizertensis]MCG4565057.1 glycine--tRNA ligase subunit beta [Anaerosalibacter bizertensis]MCG4582046.1 glycine--tRNA ligase subunit beta [Anaerosalibacter bizertensis]
MNRYLLEIGVEELPARFVKTTLAQMEKYVSEKLNEKRIPFDEMKFYSTPRRLVLLIEGLPERQEDLEKEVKGPSKKIAFDEEGNPTKALEGFMKGQGVALEDISTKEHNNVEYIFANKIEKGRSVEEILKDSMPDMIKSISFPKSMKWGGKNLRFARPIRWLLSLFNDRVLEFNLEGIVAGNITRGHRFLGSSHIEIDNIDEYFTALKDNYVMVDRNERKEKIKYGCEKLAREKGGNLLFDEELLDEITNIVEYPTPMIGRIKEEYLDLPKEVLITPMKEHQRYFPVVDDKDRLLPYFITVRNGNEEYLDIVVKGNEKVLGARLEDAKFFYYEDIKQPLENYVEDLKDIVFQEKLGTLYDKTMRVQKLAGKIGSYLEVGEETKKNIERAGYLSKADLVTNMVGEFSELQGIMGREYAAESGENEITSLAIYEQYLPRFSNDELPTTTAGAILSIGDKLDTIAGIFAIGIQPTGSQDPYGLRRQALGIINIILDKKLNLSLEELVDFALYIYVEENGLAFDYYKVKDEILNFFDGRIKNMFIDMGIRYDVVEAILGTDIDDVFDLKLRADKLNLWLDKEGLSEVLSAFNRVKTLAEKAETDEVKRELLVEEEEIKLYETFNSVEEKVKDSLNCKEYDKALDYMVSLKGPIDQFFDNVMVMVEDEELKNNRLGLVKQISNTMLLICDLSKIMNK